MAAKLLTSLLLLAEKNITQHFQLAYTAILLSINNCETDEDGTTTFKYLNIASKLLGIFTFDYNLFLKQTEIHLDKPAALLILSNMIEARPISSNFEDQERADLIAAVDKFLMSDTVARRLTSDFNTQYSILKLAKFTLNFDAVLSIAATTKSDKIQILAETILLENFEGFNTAMNECDNIIATLDHETWVRGSNDLNILMQLFNWIMRADAPCLTQGTYNFLVNQLNQESEPENRLEILMTLSKLFTLVKSCSVPDHQIIDNFFKGYYWKSLFL